MRYRPISWRSSVCRMRWSPKLWHCKLLRLLKKSFCMKKRCLTHIILLTMCISKCPQSHQETVINGVASLRKWLFVAAGPQSSNYTHTAVKPEKQRSRNTPTTSYKMRVGRRWERLTPAMTRCGARNNLRSRRKSRLESIRRYGTAMLPMCKLRLAACCVRSASEIGCHSRGLVNNGVSGST